MDLAIVVGNPKPQSRTLQIATLVAAHVLGPGSGPPSVVVDLVDHVAEIFDWPNDTMTALNDAVRASDVAIIASPTYKATYTGLLKAFLDRYSNRELEGLLAVPVMTGASLEHAMAVEVHLRSLLVELGATLPTRGLYFVTPEFARKEEIVAEWAADNAAGIEMIRSFRRKQGRVR